MDSAEVIGLFENELEFLIEKAHRSGLTYWWILRLILKSIEALVMRADQEFWMKLK